MHKFLLFSATIIFSLSWVDLAHAGLDVYSGTLERFYKKDYLSTQAQAAKELGIEFDTVYPDGEPKWLTDRNAKSRIKSFRSKIEKKTSKSDPKMSKWSEESDDYLIEQLNYDSLSALIYMTSYAIRTDLERPVEFNGNFESYPAYDESFDRGYYIGPLAVLESDLFYLETVAPS